MLAEAITSAVSMNLERVVPGVNLHASSHAVITAVAETIVNNGNPPAVYTP